MRVSDELNEFSEFLRADVAPPPSVERELFAKVRKALNPSYPWTVLKLFAFHAAGSFITLLFCPQFGISLTGSDGLMPYLMRIHPALCFFFCGISWMLVGQTLTYALLTFDEQRILGRSRWGLAFSIIVLSVLVFGCLGEVQLDRWLVLWGTGGVAVVGLFNAPLARKFRNLSQPWGENALR